MGVDGVGRGTERTNAFVHVIQNVLARMASVTPLNRVASNVGPALHTEDVISSALHPYIVDISREHVFLVIERVPGLLVSYKPLGV